MMRGSRTLKRALGLTLLMAVLLLAVTLPAAAAGNKNSDRAETLFFYANDSSNQVVLLKAVPYDTLAAMSHGSDPTVPGGTYSQSYIDAMPTPTYKEGVGVTIAELLEYVLENTSVAGAADLTYSGTDRLYFTSTDGATANFTYNALLGVDRYYFPDLFSYWNREEGAVAEDGLDTVLAGGIPTDVYLAAECAGGRVLAEDAGNNGTIAECVAANNGLVTGCLSKAGLLTSNEAFTLCYGQTEADIENSSPTYSNVKKWVYSVRLKESGTSPLTAAGTVSDPDCMFTIDGTTLTITLSCPDSEAAIYYSTVGGSTTAPLNLYTGPITVEDYDVAQPFDLGVQAMREGWVSSSKLVFNSADISDPEDAPSFVFAMAPNNTAPAVGDSFQVDLTLTSDKDCSLYGGQYRVVVPGACFDLTDATASNGWECGLCYSGSDVVVTYTYLDIEGSSGLTAGTPQNLGRLFLTAKAGGAASLTVSSALVTQANAVAYRGVTAVDVTLDVSGGVIRGDVTGDGDVTMVDVLKIARSVRGSITLTADELTAADVTGDGDVTMVDVLKVARYVRGSITSL